MPTSPDERWARRWAGFLAATLIFLTKVSIKASVELESQRPEDVGVVYETKKALQRISAQLGMVEHDLERGLRDSKTLSRTSFHG